MRAAPKAVKALASLTAAGFCMAVLVPAGAGATSISVNTTADNKTDDGLCTLREAVDAANTNAVVNPGGIGGDDCPAGDAVSDTINLPPGTYAPTGTGDDTNGTGDLDLIGGGLVTILGATPVDGAPVVFVDMNVADRAFDIRPSGSQAQVILRNLAVHDGSVDGAENGGAVRVLDPDAQLIAEGVRFVGNHAGGDGGAIAFIGGGTGSKLTLSSTEFNGNTSGGEGGGIWLDMPDDFENPLIDKSAFVGNEAGTMGGAIYVETRASNGPVLVVVNSTLSGNLAVTGGGALAYDQDEGGNTYFRFSTIANNSTLAAGGGGGILSNLGGLLGQFTLFSDSIVAGNTAAGAASNCAGAGDFGSTGYNIDSGSSCFSPSGTDLVNTNPLLAPLAANPGQAPLVTLTHGLYDESPAVNRIPDDGSCDFASSSRDQRFVPRTDGFCDVGAFEGTVGPAPVSGGGGPPASGPAPALPAKKCKKKKKKRAASVSKKKCKKKKRK